MVENQCDSDSDSVSVSVSVSVSDSVIVSVSVSAVSRDATMFTLWVTMQLMAMVSPMLHTAF
jgi:hypothetical protein